MNKNGTCFDKKNLKSEINYDSSKDLAIKEVKVLASGLNIDFSDVEEYDALIEFLGADTRSGVITVVKSLKKQRDRLIAELERMKRIRVYEEGLFEKGFSYIAGVDEVGRGPLAGPVVAAAVILSPDFNVRGINDSKNISEAKREELYDKIMSEALAVGIGIIDNDRIDEINILNATYEAMSEALRGLRTKPDTVLVDAVTIPGINLPQTPIIKGDEKSISIGAASIIAKVTRDRMMEDYDKIYPHYGFSSNKGYGTSAHYEGIANHGICRIHRRSFLKDVDIFGKKNKENE